VPAAVAFTRHRAGVVGVELAIEPGAKFHEGEGRLRFSTERRARAGRRCRRE
jgi:hypothetical protein